MGLFNLARFNLKSFSSIAPSNKRTVSFDGIDIFDAVPNAKILNVTVGAVGIESYTSARIVRAGSDYRNRRHGTREIVILVELPLIKDQYAENIRKLRAWAESMEPKALCIPAYKDEQIYATLTGCSDFTLREWWQPYELVFTAWNPYFENIEENTASVGSEFSISGSGNPYVRIVHMIDGSLTDPEWVFDDGKRIKLNGIFTGEIVIDFEKLMVYRNGESIMSQLALTSRFPLILPGINCVIGPAGGLVKWKERWI